MGINGNSGRNGRKRRHTPRRSSGRPVGHPPHGDAATTLENIRAVIASVARGEIVDAAAASHRISAPSYYAGLRRFDLWAEHDRAMVESRGRFTIEYSAKATANVARAIDNGDVKWSAWFLERRQRTTWGRSVQEPGDTGPAAGYDDDGVAGETPAAA